MFNKKLLEQLVERSQENSLRLSECISEIRSLGREITELRRDVNQIRFDLDKRGFDKKSEPVEEYVIGERVRHNKSGWGAVVELSEYPERVHVLMDVGGCIRRCQPKFLTKENVGGKIMNLTGPEIEAIKEVICEALDSRDGQPITRELRSAISKLDSGSSLASDIKAMIQLGEENDIDTAVTLDRINSLLD